MRLFLHEKPPTNYKGLASQVTFIPSGEGRWPRLRKVRTLEESRAAGERIHRILANGGQPPS
jgi:undecaprenyl pyrophosphate synthase